MNCNNNNNNNNNNRCHDIVNKFNLQTSVCKLVFLNCGHILSAILNRSLHILVLSKPAGIYVCVYLYGSGCNYCVDPLIIIIFLLLLCVCIRHRICIISYVEHYVNL